MIARLMSLYVGVAAALSCRCCCSGPLVSLSKIAILTWSGSCVLLSRAYLLTSNSQLENDSSKLSGLSVGFSNFVR